MLSPHSFPRRSATWSEISSPSVNPELWRRYQTILDNPRFSHFTRIPERIVRLLDNFQIDFERDAVHEQLLAHYLFIAVVDDAIDSGEKGVAQTVFDRFSNVAAGSNSASNLSDVAIVTEILARHIEENNRKPMLRALQRAHREVICERAARSVGSYIKHRKALGRATAKQSYLLLRSALSEPNRTLCWLMEEIGAVGCLIDSMIDIGEDHRSGLLNFDLTAVACVTLCLSTAIAGLRVLAKRPSLVFLLAEAVLDNIKDRDRARAPATLQAESLSQPIAQSFPDSAVHPL
jgi:hypothetical protein